MTGPQTPCKASETTTAPAWSPRGRSGTIAASEPLLAPCRASFRFHFPSRGSGGGGGGGGGGGASRDVRNDAAATSKVVTTCCNILPSKILTGDDKMKSRLQVHSCTMRPAAFRYIRYFIIVHLTRIFILISLSIFSIYEYNSSRSKIGIGY